MANGEWRMANGEWRMANGEWRGDGSEWAFGRGFSLGRPQGTPLRLVGEGTARHAPTLAGLNRLFG